MRATREKLVCIGCLLLVLQPLSTTATVDPDRTSYLPPAGLPQQTFCTHPDCYGGQIVFGAVAPHSCDSAGITGPRLLGGPQLGYDVNAAIDDWGIDYIRQPDARSDYPQWLRYYDLNWQQRPVDGSGLRYSSPRLGGFSGGANFDSARQFGEPDSDAPGYGFGSQSFLIYPGDIGDFGLDTFPRAGLNFGSYGSNLGPLKGTTDSLTSEQFDVQFQALGEQLYRQGMEKLLSSFGTRVTDFGSINVQSPVSTLSGAMGQWATAETMIGGTTWSTLTFPESYTGDVLLGLQDSGLTFEMNGCRVVLAPADPNYRRTGRHGGNSWGEPIDDQWAIRRVGFDDDDDSAWKHVDDSLAPVIVAVIDTGLDWHHADIDPQSVWRNDREVADNGVDDDNNGYIDDIIGWNFVNANNRPWDFDGHGTVVTGIIAAAHNDTGIAGINPRAEIMVLKAVNDFGATRASFLAEAIVYAVDNGARVINISVGGPGRSRMEQAAIEYAAREGAVVIAAAGNEGIELTDYGPGGNDGVLTIGATHIDDRAAAFSNYGDAVDLAAPGVDVLSLRARFTDANFRPAVETEGADRYVLGANVVGSDKRYLRVSGTSFSTPIVSGIASLLIGRNPSMPAREVERILKLTAEDVDLLGNDRYTGYGMVDASAALGIETGFAITAEITGISKVPAEAPSAIAIQGTAHASQFKRAWFQIGLGDDPATWRYVGPKRKYPVIDGTIATIPLGQFPESGDWQVIVSVEHKNGIVRRASYPFRLD